MSRTRSPGSSLPLPNSTRRTRGFRWRVLAENLLRHAHACPCGTVAARVRTPRLPHAPRPNPRERAYLHPQAARTAAPGDRRDPRGEQARRDVARRCSRTGLHDAHHPCLPPRGPRRARTPRLARGSGARALSRHGVRALRRRRARKSNHSRVHRRHRPHRYRSRSVPLAPAARARGLVAHDRAHRRHRRDGLRRVQPPGAPRTDSDDQVNEGEGEVGETASARTERELAALRAEIDTDLDYLLARVRDDVDPRNLARRQPVAVFGTLGSTAAIVGIALASRVKSFRRSRTETELDQIVQRLGGRPAPPQGRRPKHLPETPEKGD